MTVIELEAWKKIVDNPRAEVEALFKRPELRFADFLDDPLSWHLQAALWGVLQELDDAFARYEFDQQEPGRSEYFHWEALANRTFSLGLLRAIRENADEMTAVLADRKSRDKMLASQIAERIRAELVCPCDSFQRIQDGYEAGPGFEEGLATERRIRADPGYHPMCHYGEWGARIAEENA